MLLAHYYTLHCGRDAVLLKLRRLLATASIFVVEGHDRLLLDALPFISFRGHRGRTAVNRVLLNTCRGLPNLNRGTHLGRLEADAIVLAAFLPGSLHKGAGRIPASLGRLLSPIIFKRLVELWRRVVIAPAPKYWYTFAFCARTNCLQGRFHMALVLVNVVCWVRECKCTAVLAGLYVNCLDTISVNTSSHPRRKIQQKAFVRLLRI